MIGGGIPDYGASVLPGPPALALGAGGNCGLASEVLVAFIVMRYQGITSTK